MRFMFIVCSRRLSDISPPRTEERNHALTAMRGLTRSRGPKNGKAP
jgi:hypothetical protein